jgi:nucleotide-binding universal stress UspA family protein
VTTPAESRIGVGTFFACISHQACVHIRAEASSLFEQVAKPFIIGHHMYQRILVATGGSPWSNAAVAYAAALAARTGAELCILTVIIPPDDSGLADRPTSAEAVFSSLENEAEALLSHAAMHATRARVAYTTHAARGSIAATIQQTAVDDDCDLIVMGARQVVGAQRRTLGGIVNTVAAQATQPVMVIKAAADLHRPLGSRILVATGGSPWSAVAVEHALKLAKALQLELRVLHVEDSPSRDGKTPRPVEASELLTAVTARAATLGIVCEGIRSTGPIAEAIATTALQTQSSALVLGSRGVIGWRRPQLGAIVNAVASRSVTPVLVVKHFAPA